jgi:hypothetical protein
LSVAGEPEKLHIVRFATTAPLAGEVGGTSEPGLILTPRAEALSGLARVCFLGKDS